MKKIFFLLALLLSPQLCLAKDYDSFILHFLRTVAEPTNLQVQATFAIPEENTAEETLLGGYVLLLSLECEVNKDRILLPDKSITKYNETWLIRYDPLVRQFVALQDNNAVLQSTDADLLLALLISDMQIKIPINLEPKEEYGLDMEISLKLNSNQKGLNKFTLASPYILRPSKFEATFIAHNH